MHFWLLNIKIPSLQPRWDLIYNKVNRFFSFKCSKNHSILGSNWNPSLTKTGSLTVSQQVGYLLKLAQALPDRKQTWIFWRSVFKFPHKDLPKWKGERKEKMREKKFLILSNPNPVYRVNQHTEPIVTQNSEVGMCTHSLRRTQKGVNKSCANSYAESVSASHSCTPA